MAHIPYSPSDKQWDGCACENSCRCFEHERQDWDKLTDRLFEELQELRTYTRAIEVRHIFMVKLVEELKEKLSDT